MTYQVIHRGTRAVASTAVHYFYFQHPASITGRPSTSAQLRDALDASREQVEFVRSQGAVGGHLMDAATGQLFCKQIYLRRHLRTEGRDEDAQLNEEMRQTASELWALRPRSAFPLFAVAYVRAPQTVDALHRILTRARGRVRHKRSSTRTEPALRVLISPGWLGAHRRGRRRTRGRRPSAR